jgi:serine/threonine protein kinase
MGPIRWMARHKYNNKQIIDLYIKAPEALTHEYSTKTDIWSYGIVLSEITSRTEPHTEVDPLKIALQIRCVLSYFSDTLTPVRTRNQMSYLHLI